MKAAHYAKNEKNSGKGVCPLFSLRQYAKKELYFMKT